MHHRTLQTSHNASQNHYRYPIIHHRTITDIS
uniref:Uncharacterized protein n=1 Tax=Anguilla anguilla TaxID=7936 RepID=A0A0E9R9B8_ANGAN